MEKVIVAGFGGQGVLSLGQMLAYAAMYENMAATWLPSYGPEMRGGTANCSVVIDEKEVASPIIAVPDCLIAMNTPSLFKFQDKVKKGGLVIINSSLISEKCDRDDVKAYYVEANKIAHEVGNDKASNLVRRVHQALRRLPQGRHDEHHREGVCCEAAVYSFQPGLFRSGV